MRIVVGDGIFEIPADCLAFESLVDLKEQLRSVFELNACKCWAARTWLDRGASVDSGKRLWLVAMVVEIRHGSAEPRLRHLGPRSVSHPGDGSVMSELQGFFSL